jgi:hypothetical protein
MGSCCVGAWWQLLGSSVAVVVGPVPLRQLLVVLARWCCHAGSVRQPLLHPVALQQLLPKERVVSHQCLGRRGGFGLEGDQPS